MKVGDAIKDNDPRMAPRMLKVIDVLPDSVRAVDRMGRIFSLSRKRIYTDAKERRTGFSLVATQQGQPS